MTNPPGRPLRIVCQLRTTQSGVACISFILILLVVGISSGRSGQAIQGGVTINLSDDLLADLLPGTKSLIVSDDNMHVAYARKQRDKWEVYEDGKSRGTYDEIIGLDLSADGRRLACDVKLGHKYLIVVDGLPHPIYNEDPISVVTFSPDSKHLACVAVLSGRLTEKLKMAVVVDGTPGPTFSYVVKGTLSYSQDSRHMVYAACENFRDGEMIVMDGSRGPVLGSILEQSVLLSADGKHLTYTKTDGNSIVEMADGKKGPAFDSVVESVLSPDSRHVVYVAQKGKTCYIVVDGNTSPAFDGHFGEKLTFVEPDVLRTVLVRDHKIYSTKLTIKNMP